VPTDYENLIPHTIAAQVIQSVVEEQSAVLRLARTVPMPSGLETVPVISSPPAAGWVDAYGGLKPATAVEFDGLVLTASELATVLAIPNSYLEDAGYPIWPPVRAEIARAFARVFDASALSGTNAPSDWPAGGLIAAAHATPVTGADALAALDAAFVELESNGVPVDGILGGSALASAVRTQIVAYQMPTGPPVSTLWGVPLVISANWPTAAGLALVGGWQYVIAGLRQDVRYELSTDGVITDATGKVIVNAFQADSTLMRAYLRAGLAVANPIGSDGAATKPLALASVTVGTTRTAKS
jgi:hypothetical protein